MKYTRYGFEKKCWIALQSHLIQRNVLEALPGKLDIKRHSTSILHLLHSKIDMFDSFHFWNFNSWNMKLFFQSIYGRWNSITWLVPFGCPRRLLLKVIGVTKFILYTVSSDYTKPFWRYESDLKALTMYFIWAGVSVPVILLTMLTFQSVVL